MLSTPKPWHLLSPFMHHRKTSMNRCALKWFCNLGPMVEELLYFESFFHWKFNNIKNKMNLGALLIMLKSPCNHYVALLTIMHIMVKHKMQPTYIMVAWLHFSILQFHEYVCMKVIFKRKVWKILNLEHFLSFTIQYFQTSFKKMCNLKWKVLINYS